MRGLSFEVETEARPSAPERADVACFVGFVDRRRVDGPDSAALPLPDALRRWLEEQGWRRRLQDDEGLGLPIPVEDWVGFDRLFAWERRAVDPLGGLGSTWMGAAVRSFFAQGGRRCYVVAIRVPPPLAPPVKPWSLAKRRQALDLLIPGLDGGPRPAPHDRSDWRGVAHLFGLPDVSLLNLPDLCEMVSPRPSPAPFQPETVEQEEVFLECAEPAPEPPSDKRRAPVHVPRCDLPGYELWLQALNAVGRLLQHRLLRTVHLIAGIPLPAQTPPSADPMLDPLAEMARDPMTALSEWGAFQPIDQGGVASAFIQLAWPWVRTSGAVALPEGLEPPGPVLAGVLARNALTRGTWRSAAGATLGDVTGLEPALSRAQMEAPASQDRFPELGDHRALCDRVSLLVWTPAGLRLRGDRTPSRDEVYRHGPVSRLVSVILRAAEQVGLETTFEPSSPRTWGLLRTQMAEVMLSLFHAGALRGEDARAAFEVRCDRSTMTQHDLDSGRLTCEVRFQPSLPVDQIAVSLSVARGGQVRLAGLEEM
ncbi:MAG: phage tail sheath family protein [Alphaproteobacteria bacterium]|nr:phage tail sheath family protein [Alphaproteobacteria bacterium]